MNVEVFWKKHNVTRSLYLCEIDVAKNLRQTYMEAFFKNSIFYINFYGEILLIQRINRHFVKKMNVGETGIIWVTYYYSKVAINWLLQLSIEPFISTRVVIVQLLFNYRSFFIQLINYWSFC